MQWRRQSQIRHKKSTTTVVGGLFEHASKRFASRTARGGGPLPKVEASADGSKIAPQNTDAGMSLMERDVSVSQHGSDLRESMVKQIVSFKFMSYAKLFTRGDVTRTAAKSQTFSITNQRNITDAVLANKYNITGLEPKYIPQKISMAEIEETKVAIPGGGAMFDLDKIKYLNGKYFNGKDRFDYIDKGDLKLNLHASHLWIQTLVDNKDISEILKNARASDISTDLIGLWTTDVRAAWAFANQSILKRWIENNAYIFTQLQTAADRKHESRSLADVRAECRRLFQNVDNEVFAQYTSTMHEIYKDMPLAIAWIDDFMEGYGSKSDFSYSENDIMAIVEDAVSTAKEKDTNKP